MAWSPDGKLLATVCKDGKIRIYDPRKSTAPVQVHTIQRRRFVVCIFDFLLTLAYLLSVFRRVRVLKATEELVWCGCVMAST